jgi:hypothetical protein
MNNYHLTKLPIETPPTYTQRIVVWSKNDTGGHRGTCVMLVGYCPDTLPYFMGLVLDAASYIPDLNLKRAICSKVTKSRTIQGFTIVIIPILGAKRKIKGFEERPESFFDFGY